MAKANKNKNNANVQAEDLNKDELVNNQAEKQETKQENKKPKKTKKAKKGEPKVNKVKETVSELKKVTWPTAGQVVKNTGLVLGIVLLFTIVLFGIDYGLSWIYKLITNTL